jgi:hypothetical protein
VPYLNPIAADSRPDDAHPNEHTGRARDFEIHPSEAIGEEIDGECKKGATVIGESGPGWRRAPGRAEEYTDKIRGRILPALEFAAMIPHLGVSPIV